MEQLGDYLDQKRYDEIINEILDLKLQRGKDYKLKIQKLQQELDEIEHRLKL